MNKDFQDLIEYYDEFQTQLFDYNKEIKLINSLFERNLIRKVVDVGCGTGTHLIGLAKLGYECIGIDKNIDMISKARKKAEAAGVSITFIDSDIRDSTLLKEYHGNFDASLWIRNTLSSVNDIKFALKVQYDLLKNEGIIVFDLLQAINICEDETLNMDVATKNDVFVIRLNNFKIKSSEVHYQSVYFIQHEGEIRMIPNRLILPLIKIGDIKKILRILGFRYEFPICKYIGIPKTKSVMIYARKGGANSE